MSREYICEHCKPCPMREQLRAQLAAALADRADDKALSALKAALGSIARLTRKLREAEAAQATLQATVERMRGVAAEARDKFQKAWEMLSDVTLQANAPPVETMVKIRGARALLHAALGKQP